MTRLALTLSAVSLLAMTTACTNLAPVYEKPDAPIPATFFHYEDVSDDQPTLYWNDVIQEEALAELIDLALRQNRSLKVIAANIQIAQAQYGISKAATFPTVAASGSLTKGDTLNNSTIAGSTYRDSAVAQLGISSFELDFFSRVANQNEAALQNWLASVEGQRSAQISIASNVAELWVQLAADKALLKLAEDTVSVQGESRELTGQLFDAGVATELDVRRAAASVETARAQAAQFKAQIWQDFNALRLVIGQDVDTDILAKANLSDLPISLEKLANVPSDYLLNRPDIMAAEHQLRAAYANIGVARAAFFPSISLTGRIGVISTDLSDLTGSGGAGWSFGPSLNLPIFDNGARENQLAISEAQRDLAIAQYESAIQTAFRETSDALAVAETINDRIDALELLSEDTDVTLQLSDERFRVGVDDYLSVLDAQQQNYSAQQQLILARRDQALNQIALLRALGTQITPSDAVE